MTGVKDSSFSAGLSEIMKYILLLLASIFTSVWNSFRLFAILEMGGTFTTLLQWQFWCFYLPLQSLRIFVTVFPFSVSRSSGERWNSFPWHKLFLLLPLKKSNRISSSSCGSSAISDNWFWLWISNPALRADLVWKLVLQCTLYNHVLGIVWMVPCQTESGDQVSFVFFLGSGFYRLIPEASFPQIVFACTRNSRSWWPLSRSSRVLDTRRLA